MQVKFSNFAISYEYNKYTTRNNENYDRNDCFKNLLFDASHKDNARAATNAEGNPEINLGGRIRINFANRFTETASEIISEDDFKINKTQRLNYYSTQKWDIGVYKDNLSEEDNPSVLVSIDESESGGERKVYRVYVNKINMKDAACYEMFGAICYKTEDWFDALSSFKWALDNNYGMDRISPDGLRPSSKMNEQANPYERLNFYETFNLAVRNLELNYDERLERVKDTLLKMLKWGGNGNICEKERNKISSKSSKVSSYSR